MLIKSHPEANPDEQPYHGRFLFVTTGQAEELLNYHSAPIAQRWLSYILTFAACFFFFLFIPSAHKTSNYFNYTANPSI